MEIIVVLTILALVWVLGLRAVGRGIGSIFKSIIGLFKK